MVSPENVNVFWKLHNTITAYPAGNMMMVNMCVKSHFTIIPAKVKR